MQGMDIKSEYRSALKLDERWSGIIRLENRPKLIRKASELFAYSGDSKFWWPVLILLWMFGNTFWKQWALTVVPGIALAGIIMWPIKHLVNRERPAGSWGKKTRQKDPRSFPFGHATRSFLLAVLATGLGPVWLAVLFWIWAPLIALARVAMGVHYLSDVIGGLFLGVLVGVLWLSIYPGILPLLLAGSLSLFHLPLW